MFEYSVIRAKRRSFCITVKPSGEVELRVPLFASERAVNAFLSEKRAWVEKCLNKNKRFLPPPALNGGEKILIAGNVYEIALLNLPKIPSDGFFTEQAEKGKICIVNGDKSGFKRLTAVLFKEYVSERTREIAGICGFKYRSVRVGGARTRWGSCGAENDLIYSLYLAFLPLELIDYVILHELAHTRVKNHGKEFWALVARFMPDAKKRREEMKKYSLYLSI